MLGAGCTWRPGAGPAPEGAGHCPCVGGWSTFAGFERAASRPSGLRVRERCRAAASQRSDRAPEAPRKARTPPWRRDRCRCRGACPSPDRAPAALVQSPEAGTSRCEPQGAAGLRGRARQPDRGTRADDGRTDDVAVARLVDTATRVLAVDDVEQPAAQAAALVLGVVLHPVERQVPGVDAAGLVLAMFYGQIIQAQVNPELTIGGERFDRAFRRLLDLRVRRGYLGAPGRHDAAHGRARGRLPRALAAPARDSVLRSATAVSLA